jgi:Leucine-rich repeat (LRR) protein
MKSILHNLVLFLPLMVFPGRCEKDDFVNIPDDAFLAALIEIGVDRNMDGAIGPSEAEKITCLDLSGKGISDLTGIQAFINLDTLTCCLGQEVERTNLRVLDVSENRALTYLDCSFGRLTSLDVSKNRSLKVLRCRGNQISSLDISQNPALEQLSCRENRLTGLDVSNNPALESLDCIGNHLRSLDVSHNPFLYKVYCGWNQLTSLDFASNPELGVLDCSNNPCASLDISGIAALNELILRDMPRLKKVCISGTTLPPAGFDFDTAGSPNVHFTTECSR